MTKILIPRSDSVSAKIIEPSDFEKLNSDDIVPDYKKTGFTLSAGSGLAVNVSSGVCRLKGLYLESSAQESVSSLTASDVNYIYVKLARDSASEAESWDFFKNLTGTTPTDAFFIGTATTNGSAVTAVDQTNVIDIAIPKFAHMYYGDGRDGDVTISSSTNISELKRYNNLTINAGQTLSSSITEHACLIVQVKDTLTINGTVSMDGKGARGQTGGLAAGGTPSESTPGNVNLGNGPYYPEGRASDSDKSHQFNTNYGSKDTGSTPSGIGTASGYGGNTSDDATSNPGLKTAPTNPRLNSQFYISTAMPHLYGAGGSGGDGGRSGDSGTGTTNGTGGNGGASGAGGSGGNGGGGIILMAKTIIFNSGAVITADGADGGDGVDGSGGGTGTGNNHNDGSGGGAGHGAGGGEGGQIVLLYNTLTNSGTFTVTGGAAGSGATGGAAGGGTGAGAGSDGNDGGAGSAGATTLTQVTS